MTTRRPARFFCAVISATRDRSGRKTSPRCARHLRRVAGPALGRHPSQHLPSPAPPKPCSRASSASAASGTARTRQPSSWCTCAPRSVTTFASWPGSGSGAGRLPASRSTGSGRPSAAASGSRRTRSTARRGTLRSASGASGQRFGEQRREYQRTPEQRAQRNARQAERRAERAGVCECGCGQMTSQPGARFRAGHHGRVRPTRTIDATRVAEAKGRSAAGHTPRLIAADMGVSITTIQRWLKRDDPSPKASP